MALGSVRLAKNSFFDRAAVVKAVGKAKARVLGRQGALVMTIARRSIRKRKKSAPPGKPPSSHRDLLKDFLFFAFDTTTKTVVIGPAKLSGVKSDNVPEVLEFGGQGRQSGIVDRHGQFIPLRMLPPETRRKLIAASKVRTRPIRIDARPYMNPALLAARPYLAKQWENQVKP